MGQHKKTPNASGIYMAILLTTSLMPVTRDKRYVDTCAKVNNKNVKIGKAKNLANREKNYWKDFDQENVNFIPIAELDEIQEAETAILRELKVFRLKSPKGSLMDWLEGISPEKVIEISYNVLNEENINYKKLDYSI